MRKLPEQTQRCPTEGTTQLPAGRNMLSLRKEATVGRIWNLSFKPPQARQGFTTVQCTVVA